MEQRVLFYDGIIESGDLVEEAMLVQGGRIVALGSRDQLETLTPIHRKVSLRNHYVMPGFVDSHIHLMAYGFSLESIDLSGADSVEEIQNRCARYLEEKQPPPGKWIIGRGWDQNLFQKSVFPECQDLDAITVQNPLLLLRVCGHIAVANTPGLQVVYPEPERMNPAMKPWLERGIVLEDELEWFKTRMEPKPDREELKQAVRRAAGELARFGVTAVHSEDSYDLGYSGDFSDIRHTYQELESEEKLTVRVYQKISMPTMKHLDQWLSEGQRTGWGDDFYRIGPMKLWLDGTLGGRTAALRLPYTDDPQNHGMLLYADDELERMVFKAHEGDMQICLHAIGDAALHQALCVFEKVADVYGIPLRHRIIHCQIGDAKLYERMAALGVSADLQFAFTASDWTIVEPRLGRERAATAYAWKTLLKAGIPLAAGSDCPVEIPNPFQAIQAAVTRKDMKGQPENGFNLLEALTLKEALAVHTMGSATAAGLQRDQGSLEPGKLADFIAVSHNPHHLLPDQLAAMKVMGTWVGGRPVWQAIPFDKHIIDSL
ncbi:amidohydrolase [Anoxynatronum buryatiense]|nr:amidohydrolase [Anoxynatronum buryatiense]